MSEVENNIIFGDFNTDPTVLKWVDKSARKLKEFANDRSFSRLNNHLHKGVSWKRE